MNMLNGRKGQTGVFTLMFMDLTFVILWALALGELVATFSAQAVATGTLEGMELFLVVNMNFFIWFLLIIVNLAGLYIMQGVRQ